jgi:predicted nucleic acid-binding protein
MKIYFDSCAINRLTDDPEQQRVRLEAEAVTEIIRLVSEGLVQWTASKTLATELGGNPDFEKQEKALGLLDRTGPLIPLTASAEDRARTLVTLGYGFFDALHLASAEEAGVNALLTTDDRFIRKAARGLGDPATKVMNPIDWLQEAQTWLQPSK